MTKRTKHPTKLSVSVVRPGQLSRFGSDGYFHVYVSVVPDYHRDHVPYGLYDDCNGLRLSNLALSVQGDNRADHLYGFDVIYREVGQVNQREAAAMAKTLRLVSNRMSKLADKFGYPGDDLRKQVLHFADAVGAKRFDVDDVNGPGSDFMPHAIEGVRLPDESYRLSTIAIDLIQSYGGKREQQAS